MLGGFGAGRFGGALTNWPLDIKRRVFALLHQGRNDLPIGIDQAVIGRWAIVLYFFMELGQRVVRHHRKHVVFQVVDVLPAEGPLDPGAQASLENEARVGIYDEFVTAVRDDAGLRVNQQALQQALTTGR